MPRKPTINLGANKERDAIRAKLRRDRAGIEEMEHWSYIDKLLRWLSSRNERYAKRPGVLKGRTK